MRNQLIEMAADMMTAIGALRLKSHRLVRTSEGVEIHRAGQPALLLTHRAASDFASWIDEETSRRD